MSDYVALLRRVRAIVPRSALRYDATLARDIDAAIADPADVPADSAEILRQATNETEAQVRKDLADAVRWIADGSYDARNAAADVPDDVREAVAWVYPDALYRLSDEGWVTVHHKKLEGMVPLALVHPPVQPTELSEQFIQEAMRLHDHAAKARFGLIRQTDDEAEKARSSRAALEAHLRSKG